MSDLPIKYETFSTSVMTQKIFNYKKQVLAGQIKRFQ